MAAWTPADLGAALYSWYDASDATKVVITGSGVSQWTDKSANARHALQTDDTKRPTFSTNLIAFNAQQGLMLSGYPADFDAIFLGRPNSATDFHVILMGVSQLPWLLDNGNPANVGQYTATGMQSPAGVTWALNAYGIAYASVSHTVNAAYSRDGNALVSSGSVSANETVTSIGRTDYTQPFGEIFELVFATYGTADRQKLEGYLTWKWNQQALLPAGHPYKSAAPTTGAAITAQASSLLVGV